MRDNNKRRSGIQIMGRLMGFVAPLLPVMPCWREQAQR